MTLDPELEVFDVLAGNHLQLQPDLVVDGSGWIENLSRQSPVVGCHLSHLSLTLSLVFLLLWRTILSLKKKQAGWFAQPLKSIQLGAHRANAATH